MNAASRARLIVLLEKELRELLSSRLLVATAILLPSMFAGMALMMAWTTGGLPPGGANNAEDLAELRMIMGDRIAQFTDVRDGLALYLGEMGLLLNLLLPAALPPLFASQTLVREKQARSLETLLVTPVRTWEIVLAKTIFCTGLGVAPLYVAVAAYYAVLVARCPPVVLPALMSPGWLLTLLVASPLIGILGVGVGIAVSSRAKDAQTAEQFSGMVILPIVGLLIAQSIGVATLDGVGALVFVGGLAALDTVVLALAVSLFERETVVTRWK